MEHVTALKSVEAKEELLLEHVPLGSIYIYVPVYENIIYIYWYIVTIYLLKSSSFGTCCVFVYEASGGIISQNCSYIRNPNYPSAYEDSSSLSFTIQKCDPSKYFVDYMSLYFRDYIVLAMFINRVGKVLISFGHRCLLFTAWLWKLWHSRTIRQ